MTPPSLLLLLSALLHPSSVLSSPLSSFSLSPPPLPHTAAFLLEDLADTLPLITVAGFVGPLSSSPASASEIFGTASEDRNDGGGGSSRAYRSVAFANLAVVVPGDVVDAAAVIPECDLVVFDGRDEERIDGSVSLMAAGVERLINNVQEDYSDVELHGKKPKPKPTMVVVLGESPSARENFQKSVSRMLGVIIPPPESEGVAPVLEDVYDVVYVRGAEEAGEVIGGCEVVRSPRGKPERIAERVKDAGTMYREVIGALGSQRVWRGDETDEEKQSITACCQAEKRLAAAAADCLDAVCEGLKSLDSDGEEEISSDNTAQPDADADADAFSAKVKAVVRPVLSSFDGVEARERSIIASAGVGAGTGASAGAGKKAFERLASRQKVVLASGIARAIRPYFEGELERRSDRAFADYQSDLSKLSITFRLEEDMADVVKKGRRNLDDRIKELSLGTVSKLVGKMIGSQDGFGYTDFSRAECRRKFSETVRAHSRSRLNKAKLAGKYQVAPRKGVTLGMHWLLPEGLGTDFRKGNGLKDQDPDSIVYTPKNKRGEVDPNDVLRGSGGDWKKRVVPTPGGDSVMFTP